MSQKPFFRKHDGWWVVQMRQGRKRWAAQAREETPPKGADTKQEAYRIFNKLMEDGTDDLPPPSRLRVSDILSAFLKHSAANNGPRTFEF